MCLCTEVKSCQRCIGIEFGAWREQLIEAVNCSLQSLFKLCQFVGDLSRGDTEMSTDPYIERIRAEITKIFRTSRSGTEEKQNQEPHVESPSSTLT